MFSIKINKRLEFFAPAGVKFARHKKHDRHAEIDHVQHNFTNARNAAANERDYAATVLLGVNLRPRTSRIRGSPFQLPTRLAVGLGLESGLEISCLTSFAPSSLLRILGLPCPTPGRKPDLGCNEMSKSQSHGLVKFLAKTQKTVAKAPSAASHLPPA